MDKKVVWVAITFFLLGALGGFGYYYYQNRHIPFYRCPKKDVAKEMKEMFAEPKGEIPAMPEASKFLGEIDKENFTDAAAPEPPSLLAWDFSANKVCAYDYTQQVVNSSSMGGIAKNMDQNINGKGDVILRGKGDGTGDMAFKNMKIKSTMDLKGLNKDMGDGKPMEMEQEMPPAVFQGIKESGEFSAEPDQSDLMSQFLFPLPGKVLMVGESVELPAKIPFNAMGSLLYGTGTQKILLSKYVTANGHKTARLDAVIDISKLDVPKDLTGTYQLQVKGKSVFYFDVEDRCFHSGASAVLMSFRIEAPTPKMDSPNKDMPKMDMPEKMRMVMDSDNFFAVARNLDKEKQAAAEK